MRIVMDTDTVVAGFRSPTGASAALLRTARAGGATLLATVALFIEYEAVCMEQDHRNAAGLSDREAIQFLNALAILVEPVHVHYLWRGRLRDAGDEMVRSKRPSTVGHRRS